MGTNVNESEALRGQLQFYKTEVATIEHQMESLTRNLETSEQQARRANLERDEYIKELEK